MSRIRIDKVVSVLPFPLQPNTMYAVRVGLGFDLFMSDSTGTVAHPVNTDNREYDYRPQNSMRMYLYPDGRWISNADDNYGLNTENASESAGTGVNPLSEWENRGRFLEQGDTLVRYNLSARINDIKNSPEAEIRLGFRYADDNRWDTLGIDNDGEMDNDVLYQGLWRAVDPLTDTHGQQPFTHPINDIHRRKYQFDYVAPEDGYLVLFVRPLRLAASAGNDYFYADEVPFIKFKK